VTILAGFFLMDEMEMAQTWQISQPLQSILSIQRWQSGEEYWNWSVQM
jgi:hypothetical protein